MVVLNAAVAVKLVDAVVENMQKKKNSRELLLYPGDLLLQHVRRESVAQALRHHVVVQSQRAVRLLH